MCDNKLYEKRRLPRKKIFLLLGVGVNDEGRYIRNTIKSLNE